MHSRLLTALAAAAAALAPVRASALPAAPGAFCAHYPGAPACSAGAPACALCHVTPPARNAFGDAVARALLPGAPRPLDEGAFVGALGDALDAVAVEDADGDGATNVDEIAAGSPPGDPAGSPAAARCPGAPGGPGPDPCAPDFRYALRRVMLSFCGRSPTRAEFEAMAAAADREAQLAAALDGCLDSEHWVGKDGALWSVANRKIKPQGSLKYGDDAGALGIADYFDDYNLFVYTQTDDRDARELLTATYHVARADGPPTTYAPYTRSAEEDLGARGILGAQKVAVERRAGMLTTAWFLLSNTMFSAIPRTTAAQAYRAYLGFDIAKLEGLSPVAGEPVDYDAKGVAAPGCATCHATLDPLSYPFSFYVGLGGEDRQSLQGTYLADRPARFTHTDGELIASQPEAGVLFGQPVADLLAWAQVAAGSEQFARALVLDYWRLLLGGDPTTAQRAEFDALWRDFMGAHAYRVEAMLHALIQTEAYLVP